MPQLDMLSYDIVYYGLYGFFWTYFALLYIAASYASQKVRTAITFKLLSILVALLLVMSVQNVESKDNAVRDNSVKTKDSNEDNSKSK